MNFEWAQHRFSGGLLALDLVNTVVCRSDPARRVDRLQSASMATSFALAAEQFRRAELGGQSLTASADGDDLAGLVNLREAVDQWVRPQIGHGAEVRGALAALFSAAAHCCDTAPGSGDVPLGEAAAISAMRLFDPKLRRRTKICPNCDWLFVDMSKNRSRLWCDMAVCGNRAKAKTHYRRRTGQVEQGIAPQ
jgi:predicted RNA-binding Zn ribbon-like protein